MELKNCEKCGRAFGAEDGQKLCTKCLMSTIEDDFKLVRDYLYDNPGADVGEVSEATGVARPVILKLLKDERIEVVDEENAILRCSVCGKSIKSGRKCDECKNEFAQALVKTAREMKASETKKEIKVEGKYHLRKK